MKTIVSIVRSAPYGTSKYSFEIIQTALNKSKHCVMNLSSFVNEAALWETTQEEIQVSYDVFQFVSIHIHKQSYNRFNRHFKKWLRWFKHPHKINTHRYTQINGTLLQEIIFSSWKQN